MVAVPFNLSKVIAIFTGFRDPFTRASLNAFWVRHQVEQLGGTLNAHSFDKLLIGK